MARSGRPRAFDRDAAVEMAMRAFWQHGYEGASIETLRQEMGGISSASFYAAYGSKEQLYRETLERYLASHGQVLAPLNDNDLPPRERIERALRASARMQGDGSHPSGCMVTLSATIGSPQSADLRRVTTGIRRENREAIDRAVLGAIEDGALHSDAVAKGLPQLIEATLSGLSLMARDGAAQDTLEAAVDATMAAWDSYRGQSHSTS